MQNLINNRKNDSSVEREIAHFLDEHLYSSNIIFSSFQRTDTREEQIQGSDLLLSTTDGRLDKAIVDEKVASRYANKNLSTFSLELSFINKNGNVTQGWFVDETKTTEYYLLGWINKADIPFNEEKQRYETNLITKDNIEELDWALVAKKDIYAFLSEKGYTYDKLVQQDMQIRSRGYVKYKGFINDVSFRYSDAYIEKPINILLKKDTYFNLSTYNGTIKA